MPTGDDNQFTAYAYAPSKAALNHLTVGLVKVLGSRGITVNAIAPGMFPTKMNARNLLLPSIPSLYVRVYVYLFQDIVGNDQAMDMAASLAALVGSEFMNEQPQVPHLLYIARVVLGILQIWLVQPCF